ncbi:MAG: NADP-dependent malic enzyme [bacterium]|nr:NADP-dependent malic enzyme [bacterium]
MADFDMELKNLEKLFPENFTQEQLAKGKTILLKELAYDLHKFYGGKMITVPKAGIYGFNWFNIWYTPGVSKISTSIRDNNDLSFELTNRGNTVAVVSDSTRVLGDGDCTPPGGLGVMEGKAFLMKYLGGCDGVALCMNSYNDKKQHDPNKIIDFVKMASPSFGAINLEDISQPNCYKVLDTLREECDIPVWHDDAQGTGCVTLAGLINALKVAGKSLKTAKIVFYGAGASNTTIFRLIETDGGDPKNMIMFDTKGALGPFRNDIKEDPSHYRKWEICEKTNPKGLKTMDEAMKGADALISLSTPGPNVIKPEWIKSMAEKSIVFVCANPVPEIYPYAAKEAGAYIVATGRGDFPNQVNNSLGFPGILKGALLVRARKITDNMAIAAAHSLANYAEKKGLSPDNIIPKMSDADVFPTEARDVAMQAIKDGVARITMTAGEAFKKAEDDIKEARNITHKMMELGLIKKPPTEMMEACIKRAVAQVK